MKRALITSGGGAKGAFTVGALNYMRGAGLSDFSIISGTSTGSLIAALVAVEDYKLLNDVYGSVTGDDILAANNLPANVLSNKPYLYDPAPLEKLIRTNFTDAQFDKLIRSNITLCINAISLQTGRLMVFTTKDIPVPGNERSLFFNPVDNTPLFDVCVIKTRLQLIDALMASVSQAGFMKPRRIDWATGKAEQFVDGGNKEVAPTRIVAALGADEAYVLSNNPTQLFKGKSEYDKIFDVILRAIEIFIQDVRDNDLALLYDYMQLHGKRAPYVICPKSDLDPAHPTGLNFISGQMHDWKLIGELTAKRVLTPPV